MPPPRGGRRGATRLRVALERHRPQLARVRSDLEVAFFELCERAGLPPPAINVRVTGWLVDFFWRDAGVVFEVDGYSNHRSPAQVRLDRRKDHALRDTGQTVLRYSDEQVDQERDAIVAELSRLATPPGPSA